MKTKIIATIGPASNKNHILKKMVAAGMDIARINTKYGSVEEYLQITNRLKKIGHCKILFDIKALKMIKWLKTQNFDYLAVSFAETAFQIKKIRKKFYPRNIKIISKIETKKGIRNIDSLIKESDGIMVARGDLGKNISFEKVPLVQKSIIKKCNKKNTMVITATEMLLSLTYSKVPERSEVSDIANAVLDGSDTLMLSEETTIGKHPVLAIKIMKLVIKETEKQTRK
ncbi:hypothetical protein FP803_02630 [Candidatus Woesearchaeota archaeon]|nr:hypothetical protein [Candidatus Woesearchaeota archaeon]MBU3941903.1 pyruvate kinase [Nanoarchaeota archaeon]